MSHRIAAAHSHLDPGALADLISQTYPFPSPVQCRFVSPGVNDTYEIRSGGEHYYYRVYRAGLRSRSDVAYEVAMLQYLAACAIDVSVPVAKADGSFITELQAPEGCRLAVLFTRAPGQVLRYVAEDGFPYGQTVARLHNALDGFQTTWSRFHLDLEHLLEQPLRTIQPFAEETGHWPFYRSLADRLRARVQAVTPDLTWGLCHGDLHGHNLHKDEAGRLTLFDFDCGGPGFRAYDLAVYRWAVGRHAKDLAPWEAFLASYQGLRPIAPADLAIIPTFVAIRNLWLLGLHASQVNQRGVASVKQWTEGAAQVLERLDDDL